MPKVYKNSLKHTDPCPFVARFVPSALGGIKDY